MENARPVVDFDHHTREFVFEGDAQLAKLRAQSPIAWSENHGGYWVVTSHELVIRILRDDKNFTVERDENGDGGIGVPGERKQTPLFPGETDGERHATYRRALNPFFSKKAVENLHAKIDGIVDELIDSALAKGSFDALSDFGSLIPQRVVYDYLGLEVDDPWVLFAGIRNMRDGDWTSLAQETDTRIREIIAAKRAQPANDLLSALAQFDDPPFSEDDLVSLTVGLVLGGVATTADLIAQCFWQLEVDRDLRNQLINDEALIPRVLEEILRTFTPAFGLARTAVADVEVGGVVIAKGERVLNVFYSANRDEKKFADPDTFNIVRGSAQHVAFGLGAHTCLGAWLARLEGKIVLERIVQRIPDYRLDLERAKPGETMGLHHHWLELPVSVSGPSTT